MKAEAVQAALEECVDARAVEFAGYFFKTGEGQYSADDKFLGLRASAIRTVCKRFKDLPLSEIAKLLASPMHEHRAAALIILTERFKKADAAAQKQIYNFYLGHTNRVNNWDLVDLSCPVVVGGYLLDKARGVLYRLARSADLWERRIAIVSTLQFIRAGQLSDTFAIAEILLTDKHDLIHKATGWMLREAGKKDRAELEKFLAKHAHEMPRTMLRYSLEHFSPADRQHYMHLKNAMIERR